MTSRAHLSRGGVDVIAEIVDGAFVIRYWGSTLHGSLEDFPFTRSIANSDYDQVINPGLMRENSRGWLGYPTIRGHRNGKDWSSHFTARDLQSTHEKLELLLVDDAIQLEIRLDMKLDQFGILTINQELAHKGDSFTLDELWYWLPLPDRVDESLDFACCLLIVACCLLATGCLLFV